MKRLGLILLAVVGLGASYWSVQKPSTNESNSAKSELIIESWRSDDLAAWNEKILPVFNAQNPNINVVFRPSPATEYNAALNTKLAGGTAGDLITCRPFDASLKLFNEGNLLALNDIAGLKHYSNFAKTAWQTDDLKTTFCIPLASVIHGFIYNQNIFKSLSLQKPKTVDDFYKALDVVSSKGGITPIALGTADQWEAATMGFHNIGVNYWQGEKGRLGLISGKEKLSDKAYVETFTQLEKWAPFMGNGYKAQTYTQSQALFTSGKAAIYPAGSWDIASFNGKVEFEMSAFAPPLPTGQSECFISDHTDIGLGINAKSGKLEAAKKFIEWLTTAEFAQIYANNLPGFFPLSNHEIKIEDPLANEFLSWRQHCKSSIRNSYHILSRGTPNLENEIWNTSAQVLNKSMSPKEAAQQLQKGLDNWYRPN